MTRTVGESPLRTDGWGKVTGHALYVDDIKDHDCLWGMTIRSTVARGKLVSIEYDEDYDWSGITRVDYRDIPEQGRNLVALIEDDQPALAQGEIRHMYEPVVLLACADPERLEEAASHVIVEVEPLPPLLDMEATLASDEVIYQGDDLPPNIMRTMSIEKGDVQTGFAEADIIVEREYRVGWQEQMYIEPQGMIAVPNDDGAITLIGSLQCPFYITKALKELLGCDDSGVRVVQAVTGGGFGGKEEYPSMLASHCALLARKAGKPVKIIYDRGEDVAATTKRHPAIIRHKTGAKKDGTLTAMAVEFDIDGGAYVTLSPVVLSRGIIHATGAYRVPHVDVQSRIIATNTPPNGAFRGFGNPQVTFASERQMDAVAEAVGMDPVTFRQHNMLKEGDTTATNQTLLESVGGEECMDVVLERSAYRQLQAEYTAFNEASASSGSPLRRGVGLSFFFHGAGFTGNGEARIMGKADVELQPDGKVRIYTGSTDIGQGTVTIFPQIASTELGLDINMIEMSDPDTGQVPDSGPTVASRTTMVVGKVIQEATRRLIEIVRNSCDAVSYDPDTQQFLDHSGEPFIGWAEASKNALADNDNRPIRAGFTYEPDPDLEWDEALYQGDAYPVYSWAADVASVEVDLDTFEYKLLDFHTAEDIGKAIHPILCEGQIEGGTLQGIGYGTVEELLMRDGAVLNHRMTNYIIPTSLDAPEIHTYIVEKPFSGGPHGAKGVGELPCDGAAPAVAAALAMATGADVRETSFTPEKLQRALADR